MSTRLQSPSFRHLAMASDNTPKAMVAKPTAFTSVVHMPKDHRPRHARWRRKAHQMAFTLYLREVGRVELLPPAQEMALIVRIQEGDNRAKQELIKSNLQRVVGIARKFADLGLPLLDLISEGNVGLMTAVEQFDPTKKGKFSTHASEWIKRSIRLALAEQSNSSRQLE
jgi:DNA-directed RNA polymerase sigma subunit (sigma70/sigma32)